MNIQEYYPLSAHYRMVDIWRQMGYPDTLGEDKLNSVLKRQIECLSEEYKELLAAQRAQDGVEIIDAYCDIAWVAMMIASILHHDPIPYIEKHVKFNYNTITHFEKLKNNIDHLSENMRELFTNQASIKNAFKDTLSILIYRAWRGMIHEIGFYSQKEATSIARDAFNEVIFSNYSKVVDGKLPIDATGKITKALAKANGTYLEPDIKKLL